MADRDSHSQQFAFVDDWPAALSRDLRRAVATVLSRPFAIAQIRTMMRPNRQPGLSSFEICVRFSLTDAERRHDGLDQGWVVLARRLGDEGWRGPIDGDVRWVAPDQLGLRKGVRDPFDGSHRFVLEEGWRQALPTDEYAGLMSGVLDLHLGHAPS